MASTTSSTPLHIIDDDDDEFDWEAAVKEIDNVACQTQAATATDANISNIISISNNNSNKFLKNENENQNKNFHNGRQSTLDKFIGIASNSNALKARHDKLKSNGFRSGNSNDNNNGYNEDDFGKERVSCVNIDAEAAKTWIYPVYAEMRDYQFNITRTALFSNTLVVLPTGLGKTLIAAVVMYNYFRWFPEGKIVFAAPSRPLVMQQIEACHNIVGIPQEWTIDLTGQTNPTKRAGLWKDKRVFFVTPQVLEKDINSGSCLVRHLVCLVIDEAHRATGNYSYCVAVRQLMAVPVQLRILALSATPGSKQQTIQHVIDNLQISTLEYRNESDHDVAPYVHDRKIELVQVAMGKDAVEINDLLLEVIRPYVGRLCAIGLLQNRDFLTLSPCDLLNSREKFRQAPPENLPQMKYGEVEGYFGVLITLYHVRKLLSSHGIKPAFEMLEEKLRQGSFARLMSRNEVLLRAKLLMQQNVNHGAPSPKLSKMLEILVDHFKNNDPQNSRVIIFSNFRGSVRDIMNALANIVDFVKATEFIGQSSGKALKGQSQKVQQAVLEKFRSGKYNVIVATSIGEEGLDIMEVDLVICFDANVSPLRMIQRMGRTGRKHKGRVVVLACEGSELKGYLRKQSKSKTIKKQMRNGGLNSFNFHSSPRMIPHVFKPEVQFVELSIEQFIPRGKKVRDDQPMQTPTCTANLTDAETKLIAKYFSFTKENTWRPSLIAFPLFQSYPSRVHNVMHSSRTGLLIDAMQYLQESSFSMDSKSFVCEDEASSDPCTRAEAVAQSNHCVKASKINISLKDIQLNQECRGEYPPTHKFLFGSEFVSVDDLGMVQILTIPQLPLKEVSCPKFGDTGNLLNQLKQDSVNCEDSSLGSNRKIEQLKGVSSTCMIFMEMEKSLASGSQNPDECQEKLVSRFGSILRTPSPKGKSLEINDCAESPMVVEKRTPMLLAEESNNDFGDIELSPRLTNLIKSGYVPESPINDVETLKNLKGSSSLAPDLVSSPKLLTDPGGESEQHDEKAVRDTCASGNSVPAASINEIGTPILNVNINESRACDSAFSLPDEAKTPLAKLSNLSSSKDWQLNSGEQSESVEQKCKFRRLRKYKDIHKNGRGNKEDIRTSKNSPAAAYHGRGAKKQGKDALLFIEEEAEVSTGVSVSDDEEDEKGSDSYDDSFIDDRTNPTAASTQAEVGRVDMIAFYRRSLLSQSPMERVPNFSTDFSPDSVAPRTRTNESASTSGREDCFLHSPQAGPECHARSSGSLQLNPDRASTGAMSNTNLGSPNRIESMVENRKRKLSFYEAGSLPAHNLETEFLSVSQTLGRQSPPKLQVEEIEEYKDMFDDDQFYQSIDLDAVEEQAAKVLKHKSECMLQRNVITSEATSPNLGVMGSPSFDLGI